MASTQSSGAAAPNSADPAEIGRFAALAGAWWDPEGEFKPLHRINPVRLEFIRDHLARHFGRDITAKRPFEGLRLLDIGCGGGLVSEPLARLGFTVSGIDAAAEGIEAARLHADGQGLAIDYRQGTAEALLEAGERFDAVTALEIVEHVVDPAAFLASLGGLVRPGGAAVLSTLNRTARSFALGVVGAEYVLRWVPRGTHRWSKFLRPSELAAAARHAGLVPAELAGMSFDPFGGDWSLSRDLGVNYMMLALKPE
ncbi:MAG TPA: bifunctional 2-polyprenyl-6-hydroxyphenol methylase/3-demethylubiquinol 3-O-methyltransferase UbiG [Aliidongia sp.]|nr:bifunctional 2-polyprenyl-6-hydroxyphenol methylase/3-demethylubiquinol 3-O-methyltransferase UbiG [Aliidongia sp.]